MNYIIEVSSSFSKSFEKLKKKNPLLYKQIANKLAEISEHPQRYKKLKHFLFKFQRIHFGSYVLIFTITKNRVKIISLVHHDKAY